MPTKKAPHPPYVPPKDAHGLSRLVPGFGATPSDDALLALGYPHIVVATDEPIPELSENTVYDFFPLESTYIPRAFLPRYFQVLQCGANKEARKAVLSGEPAPWDAKRIALACTMILKDGDGYGLLVLEAMIGSAVLAEAIVTALEKFPANAWSGDGALDTYAQDTFGALYFVLLRVPNALRTRLHARLETLHASGQKFADGRPICALDVLLHGRAGVERSGYRDAEGELFQDLIYAWDDRAWVAKVALAQLNKLRPADRAKFDLQLAFVGGPKVLGAMKAGIKKFHSTQAKEIKRQLGHVP